ncbi:MAG: hypothetical protein O7G85_08690 [Planctomycetota bacterium]|nr:hypothetical protein [Planctomycetota bacterium]
MKKTNSLCPRCGYNLQGVIASWESDCPMDGVCTECGLPFEWGELLCERRAVPRWCVEYARGWGVVPATIKTLLVLFFHPQKFWRELKMVHQPHWGRLGMIVLVLAMMLYVVFAGTVGYASYRDFYYMQQSNSSLNGSAHWFGLRAALLPYSSRGAPYTRSRNVWVANQLVARTFNNSTSPPVKFARRIKWSLIVRETRNSIRGVRFLVPGATRRAKVVLAQSILLVLLCPLGFIALPHSLKKAKVRRSHLVRIWLYSIAFLVIPFSIFMHFEIGPAGQLWRFREEFRYLMFYGTLGALVLWWSLACKYYLKLPHAWGVGVSMVVLGYVLGLLAILLIDWTVWQWAA